MLDIAVFVSFFPQLVAGPIVRAAEFLPQLDKVRKFASVPVKACLVLFMIGFFKKAVISDNIAPYVDTVFQDPELFSVTAIYSAVLLYATQIYCDFSGYSDMAIAVAGLLGYRLPLNFAAPYLSHNLSDFWRRWHISLSTWLRDYLYIPLGGNRDGELKTYRNLMLTMLLGGLWHGASWNFVIWGCLHGLALSVHRVYTASPLTKISAGFVLKFINWLITLYWVCLAWIFFRASDLSDALNMSRAWLTVSSDGDQELILGNLIYFIPAIFIVHWLLSKNDILQWFEKHMALPIFFFLYGLFFALIITLVPTGHIPFIYFQF
jgi:alginate O-acetyltransferase complex protein AlgI